MNQDNEKIAVLTGEIMELAVRVNQTTEHAVFVRFAGHVSSFKVSIRMDKEEFQTKLANDEFYIADDDLTADPIKRLNEVKYKLEKILKGE